MDYNNNEHGLEPCNFHGPEKFIKKKATNN